MHIYLNFRDCPTFGLYVMIYDKCLNLLGGEKTEFNFFLSGGLAGNLLEKKWLKIYHNSHKGQGKKHIENFELVQNFSNKSNKKKQIKKFSTQYKKISANGFS